MGTRSRCLALAGLLILLVVAFVSSCHLMGTFRITGRLTDAFGCLVVTDGQRTYEVRFGRHAVPPLRSNVTLMVQRLRGYASTCMVGEMVEVVAVVSVHTDFRTSPVTGLETWGPGGAPIVLGRVEVKPGATLTILPGTVVW